MRLPANTHTLEQGVINQTQKLFACVLVSEPGLNERTHNDKKLLLLAKPAVSRSAARSGHPAVYTLGVLQADIRARITSPATSIAYSRRQHIHSTGAFLIELQAFLDNI
jgi:hypothetical protein